MKESFQLPWVWVREREGAIIGEREKKKKKEPEV